MFVLGAAELKSAAKLTGFLFMWLGGVRGEGPQATVRENGHGGGNAPGKIELQSS